MNSESLRNLIMMHKILTEQIADLNSRIGDKRAEERQIRGAIVDAFINRVRNTPSYVDDELTQFTMTMGDTMVTVSESDAGKSISYAPAFSADELEVENVQLG